MTGKNPILEMMEEGGGFASCDDLEEDGRECVRCGSKIGPDDNYWPVNYQGKSGPLCEDCASSILR